MQKHFEAFEKVSANYVPLSPVSFLNHAETLHGERTAIIYGDTERSWRETVKRIRGFAAGLVAYGIKKGDTVSVLCPNIPEMLELHFALPITGAVLNTLNTRLEPETLAYILDHADSKLVIIEQELIPLIEKVFAIMGKPLPVIEISDPNAPSSHTLDGKNYNDIIVTNIEYDACTGLPDDEWDAICLNYTSGTSGRPKGVVYHHRGAYLMAMGTMGAWQTPYYPTYLSVVPMFHCNGWGHPWVMAMLGGTVVFTRTMAADVLLRAIDQYSVTHFGAAPIILQMLTDAKPDDMLAFNPKVKVLTAGAPPPPSILEKTKAMGLEVMQVYGLTETYGHISQCLWQKSWDDLETARQAQLQAQQGIAMPMVDAVTVLDKNTGKSVQSDSQTQGEIAIRSNTVMKGYYKDPEATRQAFEGGYFWSGDGAVVDSEGYIQIKDRLKDVIISGGENISSVEVEAVLFKHPSVQAAAIVAKPDPKWGEVPCAFVELKAEAIANPDEIIKFCREHLAGFKTPKKIVFSELPKTSTGKIQKFKLRELAKALD